MQDPRSFAPDFHHVEIAIGVKRIARVVARDHHIDAGGFQLMQRGDAAPTRRAAGRPVLQEHVAHRQADDAQAGARDGVDGPSPFVILLQRERAAVADQDGRGKAALDRHVGDDLERAGRGVGAFVDVEVERPALALGEIKDDAEALDAVPGPCAWPRREYRTHGRRASPRRRPYGKRRSQTRS